MKKATRKLVIVILACMISLCFCIPADAGIKTSITKTVTVNTGEKTTIKLKGNKKKVVWTVKKGKNIIQIVKKSKTGCTIKAKKSGTAILQAKVGKKIYKSTIKVTNNKQNVTSSSPSPSPTKKPADYIGDGFTITDKELYITKIKYTAAKVVGNSKIIYDTPWVTCGHEYNRVVIDGDMVYEEGIFEKLEVSEITEDTTTLQGLFAGNHNIESVEIKRLNTDKVTDLSDMFAGNSSLKRVSIADLNGTNVRSLSYMFQGDSALTIVEFSGEFGQLQDVSSMFRNCESLSSVSVSFGKSNTSIKYLNNMFDGCKSITTISLPNLELNNAYAPGMFADCYSLKNVSIGNVYMNNKNRYAMFNENNSISSYVFASHWAITSDYVSVIGESVHNADVVYDPISGIVEETITYKKFVPNWYKAQIEKLQNVDDFYHIVITPLCDVYISKQGGISSGDISFDDLVEIYAALFEEVEKQLSETGDTPISDALSQIGWNMDAYEICKKAKEGKLEYKDLEKILNMSEDKIKELFPKK